MGPVRTIVVTSDGAMDRTFGAEHLYGFNFHR